MKPQIAELEYELIFPGSKGGIRQDQFGYWTWFASHSDGSGLKFDWRPTKRGAMTCCVAECRHFARNYGKVKYEWRPK